LNINYFDPILGDRPNPRFADIFIETATGQNVYHSLQTSYTRRFTGGIQFNANYTWSHAIDDVDDQGLYDAGPQNNNNFRAERGNSSGDARHSGSFNVLYELPFGSGKRFFSNAGGLKGRLAGGWAIAGLGQFRSGIASTVYIPLSTTGNFNYTNQRPDVVPGVSVVPVNQNINMWINPDAFVTPAEGTFGNAGRGIFFGPNLNNMDLSIIKNIPLTENTKLQIRGEFFNFLNHPNFDLPNNYLGNSGFGHIFNTIGRTIGFGTSRQIQIAARINF
jgi:hypothetical protein